ncbi:acidic leucine-rich nuclear phosphoprotein 32-related protein 1-like [Macadamia integrifolia]|uniref:acidic leucine-rich nuclear phosphoprotein 32-related protein 1-like n=1 Tax=Macadamia integrifolia TaxID=60698 RepID=UPI001C5018FF|nr:acidic leucine-rich nuclear phosphoprotein 32-related protein 1-like [Macadamia integrifolia]
MTSSLGSANVLEEDQSMDPTPLIQSRSSQEDSSEIVEEVTYDLLRAAIALSVGEHIKEHTSLIYIGREFEGHEEEANEEPSEGEVTEEEDDDDDDDDDDGNECEEDDDENDNDDNYLDWDDYLGPWNQNVDDKFEYYSPEHPTYHSVNAIGGDDLIVDLTGILPTLCIEGDDSMSNSGNDDESNE